MADLLTIHRDMLERRRAIMNLVGPGDLQFHYDDCEQALSWLDPEGHWVDLGSGAGFPGVVLAAMYPTLRVDLVESRRKRSIFLEQVIAEAGVDDRVRVLNMRAEDLRDTYDGVVARAFAPPATVIRYAEKLLGPTGKVVLFLQGDATVPVGPTLEMFHVEQYRVAARERMAVGLQVKADL